VLGAVPTLNGGVHLQMAGRGSELHAPCLWSLAQAANGNGGAAHSTMQQQLSGSRRLGRRGVPTFGAESFTMNCRYAHAWKLRPSCSSALRRER
jgi:hypothetical protein